MNKIENLQKSYAMSEQIILSYGIDANRLPAWIGDLLISRGMSTNGLSVCNKCFNIYSPRSENFLCQKCNTNITQNKHIKSTKTITLDDEDILLENKKDKIQVDAFKMYFNLINSRTSNPLIAFANAIEITSDNACNKMDFRQKEKFSSLLSA